MESKELKQLLERCNTDVSIQAIHKMFEEIIISRLSEKKIEKRDQKINQIIDDEPTTKCEILIKDLQNFLKYK
jgi:hypothetical protein